MTLLLGMTTCGFLLGEMAILATFFVHENESVFWAQIVVTLSGPAFDVISAFVRRGEGKDVKKRWRTTGRKRVRRSWEGVRVSFQKFARNGNRVGDTPIAGCMCLDTNNVDNWKERLWSGVKEK